METKTKLLPWIVTCVGLSAAAEVSAQPTPTLKRLEGAWVPDGARCKDVFFRQGTAINFARPGAATRDGILVAGTRIRDPKNACTISKTNENWRDPDPSADLFFRTSGFEDFVFDPVSG